MAELDSIISTIKNLVNAISHVSNAINRGQGNITSATVTAATQICLSSGRLVSVGCTVAGAAGAVHNAATVATAAAGNMLVSVPATVQTLAAGQAFNLGLVVAPGAGQSLNVTYWQEN